MQIALLAPISTTWFSYWLFLPSKRIDTYSSINRWHFTPSSTLGLTCSDHIFKQDTLEEEYSQYSQIFRINTYTILLCLVLSLHMVIHIYTCVDWLHQCILLYTYNLKSTEHSTWNTKMNSAFPVLLYMWS